MTVGLVPLLLGLGIRAVAAWRFDRHLDLRRRARWVVVVPAANGYSHEDLALRDLDPPVGATTPVRQIRLADGDPPVAVNLGDELLVHPDPELPTQARLARPAGLALSAGFLGYGLVCATIGSLLWFDVLSVHSGPEPGHVLTVVGVGVLGGCMVGTTVRDLPGSRRVRGQVLDVHVVPTSRKATYQPLVEYTLDGSRRKVWGMPRWTKPALGSEVTVRVGGRPPREAMRTSPLVLTGLALTTGVGVLGMLGLIGLLVE